MKYDLEKIKALCDGVRSSKQIAEVIGYPQKYIQRQMLKYNWPRRYQGSASGELSGSRKFGRVIDRDGYVLTPAPIEHPYARKCSGDLTGKILEHRFVMEKHLGRYLKKKEVVDHIDGCRLHNDVKNLRLFASNARHLKETISGGHRNWSPDGFSNMKFYRRPKDFVKVDTYNQRKKLGEIRLLQILRAHALLDKDSPYLLGTHQYLEKAEIDYSSRSKIKQAVVFLFQKWGLDPSEFLLESNL